MFRLLFTQLKKLFCSPLFFCSILGVTLLCTFSALNNELDPTGQGDVIIYCLTNYSREQMLTDISFSSFNVFSDGGNGYWMHLFMPVLAAIAAVNIFCDEEQSREKRISIFRTGRWKYYLGNILFFIIAGAIVAVMGYFLFGIFSNLCFPHLSDYSSEAVQGYTEFRLNSGSLLGRMYAGHGMRMVYFLKLLAFAMYGGISAVPALVLAAFVRNKYLITCIPFFLCDVLRQISKLLTMKGMSIDTSIEENMKQVDEWSNLSQLVSPDSIAGVFSRTGEMLTKVFLVNGIVLLSGIILALFIMRLGVDKGE